MNTIEYKDLSSSNMLSIYRHSAELYPLLPSPLLSSHLLSSPLLLPHDQKKEVYSGESIYAISSSTEVTSYDPIPSLTSTSSLPSTDATKLGWTNALSTSSSVSLAIPSLKNEREDQRMIYLKRRKERNKI